MLSNTYNLHIKFLIYYSSSLLSTHVTRLSNVEKEKSVYPRFATMWLSKTADVMVLFWVYSFYYTIRRYINVVRTVPYKYSHLIATCTLSWQFYFSHDLWYPWDSTHCNISRVKTLMNVLKRNENLAENTTFEQFIMSYSPTILHTNSHCGLHSIKYTLANNSYFCKLKPIAVICVMYKNRVLYGGCKKRRKFHTIICHHETIARVSHIIHSNVANTTEGRKFPFVGFHWTQSHPI